MVTYFSEFCNFFILSVIGSDLVPKSRDLWAYSPRWKTLEPKFIMLIFTGIGFLQQRCKMGCNNWQEFAKQTSITLCWCPGNYVRVKYENICTHFTNLYQIFIIIVAVSIRVDVTIFPQFFKIPRTKEKLIKNLRWKDFSWCWWYTS